MTPTRTTARACAFARAAASALTFVALALAACAPKPVVQACVFPENPTQPAPSWVCPPHKAEGMAVTGFGSYPKSAAGYQFSLDQATAKARSELAAQFKTRAASAITAAIATTGTPGSDEQVRRAASSLTQQITAETVAGSRIAHSGIDAKGNVYVLVGLEPEAAKRQMEHALLNSIKSDRGLWQRFQGQRSDTTFASEVSKLSD